MAFLMIQVGQRHLETLSPSQLRSILIANGSKRTLML
jgi:hypothetical protein